MSNEDDNPKIIHLRKYKKFRIFRKFDLKSLSVTVQIEGPSSFGGTPVESSFSGRLPGVQAEIRLREKENIQSKSQYTINEQSN